MYEKVICHNCQGNGCDKCHKTGVNFVEIDNVVIDLQDEIEKLKKLLESACEQIEIVHEEYELMMEETLKREGDLRLEKAELKAQLEIAKEALTFYASGWTMGFNKGKLLVSVGTDLNFEEVHQRARKALAKLETTGE